jgi:hypothetical protein
MPGFGNGSAEHAGSFTVEFLNLEVAVFFGFNPQNLTYTMKL